MSVDKPSDANPSAAMDLHSPQRQLIEWQIEHADLDALIDQAALMPGHMDELRLRRMKKRRPKPTMTPAQALAAMRAQAVSREALRRGDERMQAGTKPQTDRKDKQ